MTQKELAKKLDVSVGTVMNWENNGTIPVPKIFPQLAKLFGISAEDVTHLFDQQPTESAASQ